MRPIVLHQSSQGCAIGRLQCFGCAVLFILLSIHATWAGPQRRNLSVGVAVHLWSASRPEIDQQLELVAKAGFSMIRWDAPWKAVEASSGVLKVPANWDYAVDSANRKGITSLLILGYGNHSYDGGDKPLSKEAVAGFVRYASYLAKHFRGRVHYVEVWNEWDGNTGATTLGSPEEYMNLLVAVYPALKRIDPNLMVLGGGTSSITYSSVLGVHVGYSSARESFFEKLLHLDLLDHIDGLSIHPYVFSFPGCMGRDTGFYEALSLIEIAVRQAKPSHPIPIFVTEVGWPVGAWKNRTITDDDQAKYLVRTVQIANSLPSVSALLIYQLKDAKINHADKEENFGLVGADRRIKAAYRSVSNAIMKIEHGPLPPIKQMKCAR